MKPKLTSVLIVALIVGAFAIWRQSAPIFAEPTEKPATSHSTIDKLIAKRLDEAKIKPSAISTDEEFVRRIYLDVCGLIPSSTQVKDFVTDTKSDKRSRLISELLKNPRHAEAWAVLWNDLLRVNNSKPYRDWIRGAIRENMPYDQFARELIASGGDSEENPATNFYLRDEGNHFELVNSVSSAFMGTRMACAQCHDHPFARWTQDDFHNLMAFFARSTSVQDPIGVLLKTEDDTTVPDEVRKLLQPYFDEAHKVGWKVETKIKDPAGQSSNVGLIIEPGQIDTRDTVLLKEDAILKQVGKTSSKEAVAEVKKALDKHNTRIVGERATGDYHMPADGDAQSKKKGNDIMPAVFPWHEESDGSAAKFEAAGSRKKALADFITSNRQFAQVQVNRLWAQLMGRGIVDPTDDFREKNPPSDPELLNYLSDEFIRSKFDNRHMLELILNSETYQRSSQPNESNRSDNTLFSHQRLRRMTAEQMYDSILIATGYELGVEAPGTKPIPRAADLPVPAATGSFLNLLNQPNREETIVKRVEEGSVPQALELMNGATLNNAIRNSPMARTLHISKLNPQQIGAELYETVLNRRPSPHELDFLAALPPTDRREWIDDLYWALLNSEEFTYIK